MNKEYKNFTKKQNETFVSAYIYNHNLYAPEGEDEEKSEPSKGDRPDPHRAALTYYNSGQFKDKYSTHYYGQRALRAWKGLA